MKVEHDFELMFDRTLEKTNVVRKAKVSHCMSVGIYGVNYGKYV